MSSIRVETKPGVFVNVRPVKALKAPIANCLPPPGPYFDEFILESLFDKGMFHVYANGKIDKCIVCWRAKHVDSYKDCKRECRVCKKYDHPGQTCRKIYARMVWWQARGHKVTKEMRIHPGLGELVYLVLAGVVRSFSKVTDVVNLNDNHPLVRDLYRTNLMPQYTPGRIVWPTLPKRQEKSKSSLERKESSKLSIPMEHAGRVAEGVGPSGPENDTSHMPADVQQVLQFLYGSASGEIRSSTHSVDPSRDPRLIARRAARVETSSTCRDASEGGVLLSSEVDQSGQAFRVDAESKTEPSDVVTQPSSAELVVKEEEALGNNITSIAVQPATRQLGDEVAEPDASDQNNSHLYQRIRHLEAEVGRLNQELVAKDARIAELTSDGFSTGAKRPRR
jgi:hypothetical protein